MLGICADPAHSEITAQSVLDSNAQAVSLVLKHSDNALRLAFARELRSKGLSVLGIFTSESKLGWATITNAARFYKSSGWADILTHVQIGNEPDADPSSNSSDIITPEELLTRTYEFLAGWGPRNNLKVLSGGFVSGDPSWLAPIKNDLVRVCDGIATHAYGMRPNATFPRPDWGFGDIHDGVHVYDSLGFAETIITEWGGNIDDFDDEHQRAQYTSLMIQSLNNLNIDSFLFCLGPNMVPPFDLVDSNNKIKESYAAFADSFGS